MIFVDNSFRFWWIHYWKSPYYIKHKTACLLKAELTKDEDWLAFTRQAALAKNQLKQTALSHLDPPNQRSKSRYMNIEILLKWGAETLQILDTGKAGKDFGGTAWQGG